MLREGRRKEVRGSKVERGEWRDEKGGRNAERRKSD